MKPWPTDSELDVLRLDVDPVDEGHEDGSDYVWGKRRKPLRDMTVTSDRSLLFGSILLRIEGVKVRMKKSKPRKSPVKDGSHQ